MRLVGKYVDIHEFANGQLEVRWKACSLPYTVFDKEQRVTHSLQSTSRSRLGATFKARCRLSGRAGTLANFWLKLVVNTGRKALAVSMSDTPARRSSFTSRSWSVRLTRSTRPLA